jgi:hypothetical protein
METLLSILPFVVLFLIGRNIYVKYKELKEKKKIEKSVSFFEKYQWYRYIKLVFGTRVLYRQNYLNNADNSMEDKVYLAKVLNMQEGRFLGIDFELLILKVNYNVTFQIANNLNFKLKKVA